MARSKYKTIAGKKVRVDKYKYQNNQNNQNYGKKQNQSKQTEIASSSGKGFAIFLVVIIMIAGGIYGIFLVVNNANDDSSIDTPTTNIDNSNSDTTSQGSQSDYGTDLTVTTIDDTLITLENYAGKAIVLYFFYLDCYYCNLMEPHLQAAQSEYSSNELLVIAIDIQPGSDSVSELNSWKTSKGLNWEIVRDVDGSLTNRFSVTGTPKTFYLDTVGDTSDIHYGYTEQADIEAAIAKCF